MMGVLTMGSAKTIAIACLEDLGLEGQISDHFGRCPYYTLVDIKDGEVVRSRVVAAPDLNAHSPGMMPLLIRELRADIIISGGMGSKAIDLFTELSIEVVTGATGKVSDNLEAYLRGDLKGIVPCLHDHPDGCGESE
jgi:predicted Fe-Mo cluster-binding NifX family protein